MVHRIIQQGILHWIGGLCLVVIGLFAAVHANGQEPTYEGTTVPPIVVPRNPSPPVVQFVGQQKIMYVSYNHTELDTTRAYYALFGIKRAIRSLRNESQSLSQRCLR